MQKVEKWRVEELALVLSELTDLLKAGDNREWANVFSHYYDETQKIVAKTEFDSSLLSKLVGNVRDCFHTSSSFTKIALKHDNPKEEQKLNQALYLIRARLLKVLKDLEERIVELVH